MALGKLPEPGRPTVWMIVGQGPIALAIGADGVVWTFLLFYIFPLLFLSLFHWEMTRYRLKYCFKGSLSSKQLTNIGQWSAVLAQGRRHIHRLQTVG